MQRLLHPPDLEQVNDASFLGINDISAQLKKAVALCPST